MKWLKTLLILAVVLLVLIFALVAWVFYTTSGARFVLTTLSRLTSFAITTSSLKGDLARGLEMSGFSMSAGETRITADRAGVTWSPLQLFPGRVSIRSVRADDVRIIDRSPDKQEPLDLSWPRVGGVAALFYVEIKELRIDDLSYVRQGEKPVFFDSVAARLIWNQGELIVRDLRLETPEGTISGQIKTGFRRPSLRADLHVAPVKEWAGLESFRVKADLRSKTGPTQMAGPITATVQKRDGKADGLSVNAFLALEEHGVQLSRLQVVQGKQGGSISGEGGFSLKGDTPSFSIETTIKDFNLQPFIGTGTSISGHIKAAGTTADYTGSFALQNEADDWQSFKASGTFHGDTTQAVVKDVTADWLGGSLNGRATIDWKKGARVQASLEARGLDPELIDETWSGTINADAALRVNVPSEGGREVFVDGKLLRSTFRGQPVRGAIAARLNDGRVTLKTLDLKGKGFDIHASGVLSQRITFDANVSDLSALFPRSRVNFRPRDGYGIGKTASPCRSPETGTTLHTATFRSALFS